MDFPANTPASRQGDQPQRNGASHCPDGKLSGARLLPRSLALSRAACSTNVVKGFAPRGPQPLHGTADARHHARVAERDAQRDRSARTGRSPSAMSMTTTCSSWKSPAYLEPAPQQGDPTPVADLDLQLQRQQRQATGRARSTSAGIPAPCAPHRCWSAACSSSATAPCPPRADPAKLVVRFNAYPVMTLWNPYNVDLDGAGVQACCGRGCRWSTTFS